MSWGSNGESSACWENATGRRDKGEVQSGTSADTGISTSVEEDSSCGSRAEVGETGIVVIE